HSLIAVPADFPGQLYIRHLIVQKLNLKELSPIPDMVTCLVPFLEPLHVSLNT
ncbi:2219_t:CDS:1, partial [Entrophospora sp. SA101]